MSCQLPVASCQKFLIIIFSLVAGCLLVLRSLGEAGLLATFSFAQEKKEVSLYFFYSKACPHCTDESRFLDKLEKEMEFLQVNRFEVNYNQENNKLLSKIGKELQIKTGGIPITIIGPNVINGYLNDETTGQQIKKKVVECSQRECLDLVKPIIQESASPQPTSPSQENPILVKLPFLGKINVKGFSLPVLTVVLGLVDGFNPCAMWVLLFLISLLLGMKDKKRMWTLGIAFITVSGFAYYLFMAAWLNLLLFLGFITFIRIVIGLVAMGSGAYHLKEYFTNKNAECKVVKSKKRQKIFESLRKTAGNKSFLLALVGIIFLAFAVNLVELVCSAGLPTIYTQILTLSNLAKWQYYFYILLYIFFFMLDDLFVFAVAMITLQAAGISHKYTRASNLVGGIIIFALGLLLIFKPEWVMFG